MKPENQPKIKEIKPNKDLSPTAKLLFEMFEQLDCVAVIEKTKK